MSDDLVKRLRELNTFEWHARPATTKEVCFEAANRIKKLEREFEQEKQSREVASEKAWKFANRIEKLEAALREIIVHCEVPAPPNAEALKMFARNALEENNE